MELNEYEQELNKIGVHKVMTKEIAVASKNNSFTELFQFFVDRNVNHLPVCNNGVVEGVLSSKDMMRALFKHIMVEKNTEVSTMDQKIKIADIMTKDVTTIDANKSLYDARELFYKKPWNCLPVTHDGKIVGIMTPQDFVKMKIIHIDGSDYGGY